MSERSRHSPDQCPQVGTDIVSHLLLKLGSGSTKQSKFNPSTGSLSCYYVGPEAQRVFHICKQSESCIKAVPTPKPLYPHHMAYSSWWTG